MNEEIEDNLGKPWQVERFEELASRNESIYFDVSDFEEIIDYYQFTGIFKEALNVSDYAIGLHGGSITLMLKKAQLLASFNKEDHALKILTEVETLEPSNNDIFLTKGAIYSQLRNYEKAIEEYNKAIFGAEEPDYVYCNIAFEYENLGNFDKTLEYLSKALEVNPDNDLAIYEAAYCFDLLSLTEEGISFFHRLIDRNPYSSEAWFNLGVSYINAGLYEKALEALDYALAIDEDHEHSWFHKGYVLNLMERYQEAIEAFNQSISEEEADPMKYYYIGECYEKLEAFTHAREYFLKATEMDPEISDAWVGIGICELENDKPEQALTYFQRGLDLDPENPGYLCLIASTYATLNRYADACSTYEKAVLIEPGDIETWLDYAETVAGHKMSKATAIIKRGIKEVPDSTILVYRLAAYLFISGKEKEGLYYLEEALSANHQGHQSLLDKFPRLLLFPAILDAIERYRI